MFQLVVNKLAERGCVVPHVFALYFNSTFKAAFFLFLLAQDVFILLINVLGIDTNFSLLYHIFLFLRVFKR
jgi:hypothetical protein